MQEQETQRMVVTTERKPEISLIDLAQSGIERGKEIKLSHIEALVLGNHRLIEGSIKRNFYWELREAITTDFEDRTPRIWKSPYKRFYDHGGEYGVYPFHENVDRHPFSEEAGQEKFEREKFVPQHKDKMSAEFLFRLSSGDSTHIFMGKAEDLLLSFVVSAPKENAEFYWNKGAGDTASFTSVDDFDVDGVFVYVSSMRGQRRKIPLEEAVKRQDELQKSQIDFDKVVQLLEVLEPKPEADCSQAFAALEQLSATEGLNKADVDKLKQAIQEFATFVKPEPISDTMCRDEVGRCLTTPHTFCIFVSNKFGVELATEHYGSAFGGYHQVNTLGKTVFIDWTARQFGDLRNTPYPYIYHRSDPKHGGGRLWSDLTKEEQEEIRHCERLEAAGIEY